MQSEVEQNTKIVNAPRKPPAAGNGRPKGAKNKNSKLLKDAILEAAERLGDSRSSKKKGLVAYLEMQAEENPVAFMSLMGKVLPMQVTGSGAQGEHEFVIKWKS